MPLQVTVTPGEAGVYRVKLVGMLDSKTVQQLDDALQSPLADPEARALRLELQDLAYISSLGLGMIAKAKKAIEAKGGVLALIGAQPQVARVFEIVRLLPREIVFASRDEADAYFAMIQKKVLEGEIHPTQHP
jgi:anti-anti-sigma factor